MRRRVPGKAKMLLALPEDLVQDCRWDAIAAETADGKIIAVMHQAGDGLLNRCSLIGERAWLGSKMGAGMIGRWVRKKLAIALGENIH